MKRLITLLVVSLLLSSLFAQQPFTGFAKQITVAGQVKDQQTRKPLEYVNIYIINLTDSTQTLSFTDDHGFFEFQLKPGAYKLIFSLLGYEPDTITITGFSDQNLGIVYLNPKSEQLEEVTVKAKVRQIDVDKEEILVTKQMRMRATNTNELLEQINGVTYNRYNRQIAVDGETNVIILVNGLKKDRSYVEMLNPERIQKIEIIRDPGGRYGLEGYAAVINIILKDNYQGIDLTSMLNGSVDYKPVVPSAYLASVFNYLNLNYTRGKVNFYTTYYLFSNHNFAPTHVSRVYQDGHYMLKSPTVDLSAYNSVGFKGTFGLDYKLNPLHSLSFELKPTYHPKNMFVYRSETQIFSDTTMKNLLLSYAENQTTNNITKAVDAMGFYKGHFNHGLDLLADVRLGNSNNVAQTLYRVEPVDFSFDAQALEKKQEFEYNLDLTYSYGKIGFNAGVGYLLRNMSSEKKYSFLSNNAPEPQVTPYSFSDNKLRGYAYAIWKPVRKLSVKTGLGAEYYRLTAVESQNNLQKSMMIYQPFFNLTYKPLDFAAFILKFRTKTKYPSATQLDPTPMPNELGIVKVGNPELNPQVTYQTSLKISVFQGVFSVEPYYQLSRNYIADYVYFNANDSLTYIKPENIAKFREKGVKLNFVIPFSKKLIWQNSLKIYGQGIEYQDISRKLNDFTASSNLIYYNPKLISIGLIYMNFGSRNITPQGYTMKGLDFLGFFLQKSLFDKKLSITLFGVFPFNSVDKWLDYNIKTYSETPFYTESMTIDLSMIKHFMAFNLQYRFSKGKTIKVKKPEKEQEQNQKQQGFKLF